MEDFKKNEVVYTQREGQIVDIGLVESVSPFLKVLTPYRTHLLTPYYSTMLEFEKEWRKSNVISNPAEWFQVTRTEKPFPSAVAKKYGIVLSELQKTEEIDDMRQDKDKRAAEMYADTCKLLECKPLGSGIFSRNNQ